MGTAVAQERGTTSNRYTILGRLAGGGMADIFLVLATTEAGVGRHLVLKRVLAARARDPVFARLFLDEARLAAQLQHPNIAQVYDVGRLGGSYFFTMEYVHGEDVRTLLKHVAGKHKQVPVNLALYIVGAAAAALHHAHERTSADGTPLGIVHRDVSPSNIIISTEGSVKVIDFGVARAAQNASNTKTAGGVKGKIGYMSPEQVRGRDVDPRSDVFSLGIVLHELLTARRLFKRDNDYGSMDAVIHEDTPPPSKYRPDLSPEIDRIVQTALQRDLDKRYASAAAMLEDIEAVATMERHLMSATAMSKYMREQFGVKPEPWHELRNRVGEELVVQGEDLEVHDGTMTEVPIDVGLAVEDAIDALAAAPQIGPANRPSLVTPVPGEMSGSFTPVPGSTASSPANKRRSPFVIPLVAIATIGLVLGVAAVAGVFSGGSAKAPAVAPEPAKPAIVTPPPAPAPPPTPAGEAPPHHATLSIAITGAKDAEVKIDGAVRGHGASVELELAAGPHDLIVAASGRAPITKHFELEADENRKLEIAVPPAAVRPHGGTHTGPTGAKDPCSDRDYVKANPLLCQ